MSFWLPTPRQSDRASLTAIDRLRILLDTLPLIAVFTAVMGSIYFGIATPTEAAAVGVVCALLIALVNGRLTLAMLHSAFLGCVRTTSMILFIIVSAYLLNFVLSFIGLPQEISNWVKGLGLSPVETIYALVIFYLILGCFLEALAMMITTVSIIVPLVVALGFDPLWFGIFMVLMMELALITPPVGLNLYVVQGIRITRGDITDVFIGTVPFIIAMLILVVLLIHFPAIALWLPHQTYG